MKILAGAMLLCLGIASTQLTAVGQSTSVQIPTDWDLYMSKLVNRARTKPAQEDLLQGTSYRESPVGPLAYSTQLGRAAQNHTEWMSVNRDNPLLASSFRHAETIDDGLSGAGLTVGWSGDSLGQRVNYVGYRWTGIAENIIRGTAITNIDKGLIDRNHAGWWASDGHRSAIMNQTYTAFGYYILSDGGQWATEVIGQPKSPYQHIFGVLYADMDNSNDWNPRDADDPLREGLAGMSVTVLRHDNLGRPQRFARTETLENGSFVINVGYGVYDVATEDGRSFTNIRVRDDNIDLGDLAVELTPGDANRDLLFNSLDIVQVLQAGKYLTNQSATWLDGDWDGDGLFGQQDIVLAMQTGYRATTRLVAAAPEPSCLALLLSGMTLIAWGSRARSLTSHAYDDRSDGERHQTGRLS